MLNGLFKIIICLFSLVSGVMLTHYSSKIEHDTLSNSEKTTARTLGSIYIVILFGIIFTRVYLVVKKQDKSEPILLIMALIAIVSSSVLIHSTMDVSDKKQLSDTCLYTGITQLVMLFIYCAYMYSTKNIKTSI